MNTATLIVSMPDCADQFDLIAKPNAAKIAKKMVKDLELALTDRVAHAIDDFMTGNPKAPGATVRVRYPDFVSAICDNSEIDFLA